VLIGKAFKGAAVVILLQPLDNAANEHIRERLIGEIFTTYYRKTLMTNRSLVEQTISSYNKLISLYLQNSLERFHEISGFALKRLIQVLTIFNCSLPNLIAFI
jgi:hypothetical protein